MILSVLQKQYNNIKTNFNDHRSDDDDRDLNDGNDDGNGDGNKEEELVVFIIKLCIFNK